MTGFSSIDLKWQGKEYHIPANRVLETVAAVEEVVTVNELFEMSQTRRISSVKIARAYAQVMRSAGIAVKDEEAYERIISGSMTSEAQFDVLINLICMLLPKSTLDDALKVAAEMEKAGGLPKGKGKRQASGSRSSRRTTSNLSSRESSSPLINSGGSPRLS